MSATQMPSPVLARPSDEQDRLAVLHRYNLLDAPSSDDFTFLTELAARVCEVPYAFISLVDRDRVWVKSYTGMAAHSFPRDQCYCSIAILSGEGTEIADLSLDARTAGMDLTRAAPGMRMYSSVTLRTSDGYALGTLCVLDTKPGALSDDQRRILRRLARQVMALIELRANEKALKAALDEMETLATIDVLTGLLNRRALLERLTREAARVKRYHTPLSAVMLDLDSFKRVNDRYGHAAGDRVLRNVGQLVRDSVRVTDIAGRYGGEELCVVLPSTGLEGACAFAEALRVKIAALDHHIDGLGSVTASLGVGAIDHSGGNCATLLKLADDAMYRAKRSGRNRVEC